MYHQFNQVQRQWRLSRAWKRAGVTVIKDIMPEELTIGIDCVSCPVPGVNMPSDWQNDPDALVIFLFISVFPLNVTTFQRSHLHNVYRR